jgi:hypothetical protein
MKAFAVMAIAVLVPVSAAAQSASVEAASVPATIPVGTRVGEMPTGYADGGRRDPFATLVRPKRTGPAMSEGGKPKTGLAALALADVTVRGIVKAGPVMMATIETPSKQSFTARVKDRILDAVVKSIDANGVVFAEETGSGASVDVRKALRPTGEEVR